MRPPCPTHSSHSYICYSTICQPSNVAQDVRILFNQNSVGSAGSVAHKKALNLPLCASRTAHSKCRRTNGLVCNSLEELLPTIHKTLG